MRYNSWIEYFIRKSDKQQEIACNLCGKKCIIEQRIEKRMIERLYNNRKWLIRNGLKIYFFPLY